MPGIDAINIENSVFTPPSVEELTTGSLSGTGVFDRLMSTMNLHLDEEYKKNRISGAEFATVYLGALQAVLAQSVIYIQNDQNKQLVKANIGLTVQKTVTELAQTDDDIPADLGFNNGLTVEGLVQSQINLNTKQGELVDQKILNAEEEALLAGQKVITELAQTADTISTEAATHGLGTAGDVAGIISVQKLKLIADQNLSTAKVVTEASSVEKLEAEATLLAQKTNTELAQTSDSVVAGTAENRILNSSTTLGGSISVQMLLQDAQTKGFARDAEQKVAQMLIDTWKVSKSVDTGVTADSENQLHNASLGAVVEQLKKGINIDGHHA